MQKKIIALAIAAAMAAPAAALAEATVYGVVDMSIDMTDDGGDTRSSMGVFENSRTQISSNQSRIGVKGSEAVGDLTVVWQMETEVAMDTGAAGDQETLIWDTSGWATHTTGMNMGWAGDNTGSFFNRNTYVGLAGGFGTVILGQHDTPYKMATRKLDVFADSIADNRGNMGGGVHDTRLSDVLAYVSPDFSGATVAVAYVGETDNTILHNNLNSGFVTQQGATSLSVNYARDNFTVAAATQSISLKTAGAGSQKITELSATKLGGSYSMDMFSVGLVYETLAQKDGPAGWNPNTKTDSSNIYIGATYNVSDAGTVKAAYTMVGESKVGGVKGKDGATQMSLGYDHELSKTTTLYAMYTSVGNDKNGSHGLFGLSAGNTATGSGDPSAISLGIKHSF